MVNRNGIARRHPGVGAIAGGVAGVVGGKQIVETSVDGQVARGGPQGLGLQQKLEPRAPPLGLQQKGKPRAPTPI